MTELKSYKASVDAGLNSSDLKHLVKTAKDAARKGGLILMQHIEQKI